jgi:hypothetical protein
VNLIVALRAVTVIRWTQRGIVVYVSPTTKMVIPVPHVAAQAQERRRLAKQVVGYRAMRFVADGAILRHRWMFVNKGTLFICVAFVANQVQRWFFEISFGLAMRIVAIGASDFSFFDRMMRRESREPEDFWMAFVARLRFVHRHRQTVGAVHGRVADVNHTLNTCVGMRIVAVGARNSSQIMRRRMPRRVRRRAVMTFKAKLFPR